MASPKNAFVQSRSAVEDPVAASQRLLIDGARRWMRDALDAWSDDDLDRVAMTAPLSVELLGKAALWKINPVLVVPSAPSDDVLLRAVEHPDLRDPTTRTIGLSGVLSRLDSLLPSWPIPKERRTRLANVRNGAAHVGLSNEVESVLQDCLLATTTLLPHLKLSSEQHFLHNVSLVEALMSKRRETVSGRVTLRRERAIAQLANVEARLGQTGFTGAVLSLEAARRLLDPQERGRIGVDADCPACGHTGRLLGVVDVEMEVEVDYDFDGEESFPTYMAYPSVSFSPDGFACPVCKFRLTEPEELEEADLPFQRYGLTEGQYDQEFLDEWLDAEH